MTTTTDKHRTSRDAHLAQLTEVQIMRAEGRTRKATVDGKRVQFQRLSPKCHVYPSWDNVWPGHYRTAAEAREAAEIYERTGVIERYGFKMGGQ